MRGRRLSTCSRGGCSSHRSASDRRAVPLSHGGDRPGLAVSGVAAERGEHCHPDPGRSNTPTAHTGYALPSHEISEFVTMIVRQVRISAGHEGFSPRQGPSVGHTTSSDHHPCQRVLTGLVPAFRRDLWGVHPVRPGQSRCLVVMQPVRKRAPVGRGWLPASHAPHTPSDGGWTGQVLRLTVLSRLGRLLRGPNSGRAGQVRRPRPSGMCLGFRFGIW